MRIRETGAVVLLAVSAIAAGPSRGSVSGVVLDGLGKPVEGARIWVKPSLTTGLVQARTGPDGRYKAEGLINVPYNAYAWIRMPYRDKNLCLRVAPVAVSQYDSFVPQGNVTRDFKLRVSGLIDDRDNIYYGGEIRVFYQELSPRATVEFKFEPLGVLADGSAGKTLVRSPKDMMIEDVPVGAYRVTAQITEPSGWRRAARVGRKGSDMAAETVLEWESPDSCIGGFGNGLARAFLYVQ